MDYHDVRKRMIDLITPFSGLHPTEAQEPYSKLNEFIRQLTDSGWRRRDLYVLVRELLEDASLALPEESFDRLLDVEGNLIGHCDSNYIMHFPGEPMQRDEFLDYVYSKQWLAAD